MAEQIADLVVNLDANTVSFQEQMGRVERQLLESSRKADVSTDRMRRLAERQAATISGIAENSAGATTKMQASQAVAVDGMKGKWSEASRAVDETHQRIAELSARLREEQQQSQVTGDAQDRLTASFFRQIDAVKGTENSLQELRVIQEQIRVARASGNITQGDYLSLVTETATKERALAQAERAAAQAKDDYLQKLREQVALQGKTASQIQEYKAAQLGVSQQAAPLIAKMREQEDAWKRGAISAGQYRMAMRQLPMQITDITTSLASGAPIWLVAIQQGGQIKDSFGGAGNALKAMLSLLTPARLLIGGTAALMGLLAYDAYDSSTRIADLNRELVRTNGVSGLTKQGLQDLVYQGTAAGQSFTAVTDSLKALIAAGATSGTNFSQVSQAIAAYSKESGEGLDVLAGKFTAIAKDPSQGILALNESLHFLTAEQYANIRSLEEQGRQMDAVKLASDLAADAMHGAAVKMKTELSSVESYMRTLKDMAGGMWDAITGVFRDKTAGEATAELQSRAASIQAQIANSERTGYNQKNGKLQAWREELDLLNFQLDALSLRRGAEKGIQTIGQQQKENEQERLRLAQQQDALATTLQTKEEKRKKLIDQTNEAFNQGLIKSTAARDKQIKRINEQFKDPKTAKGPQYRTPAGERATDSTQSEMLALQTQLQVLRQHSGLNDTISQQRKDLWKAQAQFIVLEEAAGKRQLSAQEKSLLSSKDKVLALAEQKAALGDQIAQQERINKLQDASTKYVTQMAEKQQALQRSAGLGDRAAQRESTFAQLSQGWQNQGGSLDDAGYKRQLQAAQDYYAAEDKLRGDWMAGASSAWSNYQDQASDTAGMTKSLFTGAFSGMEDALTSFVTTGKAGFKSFTVSILADLAKIALRMALSQGLQSLFGAFSGGAGNNPGAVPMFANAKGGVYSSPSLSAYSGQVVSQPTFFAFAKGAGVMGEAGAEGILPLKRGPDGRLGVSVYGGAASGATGAAPQVNIKIADNGQSSQQQTTPGLESFGADIGNYVAKKYRELRDKDLRQNGVLNQAIRGGRG
ncbi:MAG: phage tail tape measure protein [Serratia liquefaciens]|jgi:lambda family phage tail tape measure protein|nr:phage tail tape measure protein [Serratia liquefaciens]MCH4234043.1 phage tail tape measure protein [Serratia liquefaciens]MCH4261594.1 phage tail tape measure protein [Serratia liquefaciens]MCI1214127.1 phage tail tape measure protein [Serratia liquefaciens]MCI1235480.1 phage tail tape measure protein [Serratia liquefaciens]